MFENMIDKLAEVRNAAISKSGSSGELTKKICYVPASQATFGIRIKFTFFISMSDQAGTTSNSQTGVMLNVSSNLKLILK